MLTCNSLRGAVLTSGLLLVAAWVVGALAATPLFPTVVTVYTGFLLIIAAALLLGGTFLLSLLPGNASRLAGCER